MLEAALLQWQQEGITSSFQSSERLVAAVTNPLPAVAANWRGPAPGLKGHSTWQSHRCGPFGGKAPLLIAAMGKIGRRCARTARPTWMPGDRR